MKDSLLGKFLPHIIAFVTCLVISFAFFSPYIIDNKVLGQADNTRAYGMQGESTKVKKETGEYPLWTNSMFGGMPAYQIVGPDSGNLNKYVYKAMLLWHSITDVPYVILLAMLCCYLFLIVLKVDWRIAIAGAVGFGLSTYYMDIAEAGHSTKMVALALVPGVLSGLLLALRGRLVLGGVLFGIFLSVQVLANHLQITFYLFLLIGILGIIELIDAGRKKAMPQLWKSIGVLALCGLFGILANTSRLWTTYEYSKETIRGTSELTPKAGESGDGLTKKYMWDWSYGKMESMTLLVQNFNGGGASQSFEGTETYKRLFKQQESQFIQQGYSREQARVTAGKSIASLFYWGDQPFVGVAIYAGAILIFLFFLGAFLVEGKMKWWVLISAFFTLSLAWGGNFFLNHLLVDYVPMFNKFRAVSMALGLTQLFIVVLAAMGLQAIVSKDISLQRKQKSLLIGLGITGGLCLLAIVLSGTMDFNAKGDARLASIIDLVKSDRAAMMRGDAIRSLLFVLVSAALIFAYLKGKLKALYLVSALALLITIDAWTIDRRIINKDKYEPRKETTVQRSPVPSAADTQILAAEKEAHYRVLDLSRGNPFVSWDASFHHKSIGGYHAAKLMRFKDLIERYLTDFSKYPHIVDMLNVKWLIPQPQNGQVRAVPNSTALGNAWFVNGYDIVDNGDAEMAALATLKPREKAVVQKDYAAALAGLTIQADPTASIKLTSYHPDKMVYDYNANSEQLAVFSEIFYGPNKGWNLYIDDKKIDNGIIKVNYLLRGARLPAGKHKVEMRFEPKAYYLGRTISMIASGLLLLALFGGLFFTFKEGRIPDVDHLDDLEVKEKASRVLRKTTSKKESKKDGKKKGKKR